MSWRDDQSTSWKRLYHFSNLTSTFCSGLLGGEVCIFLNSQVSIMQKYIADGFQADESTGERRSGRRRSILCALGGPKKKTQKRQRENTRRGDQPQRVISTWVCPGRTLKTTMMRFADTISLSIYRAGMITASQRWQIGQFEYTRSWLRGCLRLGPFSWGNREQCRHVLTKRSLR